MKGSWLVVVNCFTPSVVERTRDLFSGDFSTVAFRLQVYSVERENDFEWRIVKDVDDSGCGIF
jgi:hypothetical protein